MGVVVVFFLSREPHDSFGRFDQPHHTKSPTPNQSAVFLWMGPIIATSLQSLHAYERRLIQSYKVKRCGSLAQKKNHCFSEFWRKVEEIYFSEYHLRPPMTAMALICLCISLFCEYFKLISFSFLHVILVCVPPTGLHAISNESVGPGQITGKPSVEEMKEKVQRSLVESDPSSGPPSVHACTTDGGAPGPPCPVSTRLQWQMGPWSQQEQRPQEGEAGSCSKDEDDEEEEEDFEGFTEGTFSRDTYDEIEDGTGQVSQRPLVPVSPDFTVAGSEVNWPSTSVGQGGSLTPTSNRNLSPSSAAFPPPCSPPTPSSSSSVSLAGAPYTGKVHFCHCGKAYTLKSMRDRHVKMQHLNLRPFGCPVCTKSFKMKHHLTKHLKTHGGLRPYECGLCGKKVIWRDSFLRHQARCERLASSSSANSNNTSTAAADMDDGYSYGFEDGEAFLAAGGQVKVEEVDFHGEMEDGMGGLLGSVSGIVDQLRTQSQNVATGSHVFKEEASESFSGN